MGTGEVNSNPGSAESLSPEDQAKVLRGGEMMAVELAHIINNRLVVPMGVLELLSERADIPDDARALMAKAAAELEKVPEVFRRTAGLQRLATKQTAQGEAFDLERSSAKEPTT